MATEFGIFTVGEGQVEGDFTTQEAAVARMASEPDYSEDCYVAECCPDHRDQEKDACDKCPADDAEDIEEEE